MSSLAPIPPEQPTCEHCGAALVADQRYCLSCGQPVSPVRLAFLDVLQSERQLEPSVTTPVAIQPAGRAEDTVGPAWLRRYAPIFAVCSVLLLALVAGLLIGHWATQSKGSSTPSVLNVHVTGTGGLSAATTPSSSEAAKETKAAKTAAAKEEKSTPTEEKKEESEARAEEAKHAAPPPPVKASKTQLSKLDKSTGRKHEEELNKIGTAPIETP